jgi:catechol 2,3-dioxygenase
MATKSLDLEYGVAPPNYRLPSAAHVGRVKLLVSDLSRSQRYYETILGLRALDTAPGRVTLGAHGSATPLVELHERKGARAVPRRGRLGLFHFAVLLPDRASLGRFLRHLTETETPAGMSDHLVSEALYLQDPDNLGIEVYADRPRSAWKHEGRQLTMATLPLDARDLVEAGGSQRWRGAPAGTTIGHVHLHVGDIDQASAFYHGALGFDKMVWNYPGALFLAAGGYHHHLGTNTWAQGAPSPTDEDARLLEWEIVVPEKNDVEAAAASLEGASYAVQRLGADAIAQDPWGTGLRLTAG